MTNKERREQIKDHIHEFSLKERQYEAWLVCDEIVSSTDEDYSILFDDLGIEYYVDAKYNYMTKQENDELKNFVYMLNEYRVYYDKNYGLVDNSFDSEKVYNDAEWDKVRQEAKRLYNLLEKEEGIENLIFIENWNY
ncbi:MAG: hypothetical protein HRT43_09215 [Campylobacteraceae bacterium]|nr:hypothetical protein [Campylobacteraceae bacterium]